MIRWERGKRYADQGTFGLPVWLWPVLHPVQKAVGKRHGLEVLTLESQWRWWRYPWTALVAHAWEKGWLP